MKKKLDWEAVCQMDEFDLCKAIYAGASFWERRNLRFAISDDAILELPNHPQFPKFTDFFQNWVWSSINSIVRDREKVRALG